MIQDERIRLSGTNSVNSVNRESFVDVELNHHTKVFPFPNISEEIDQMEVFEKERSECSDYRLILTINPYCTNILYNMVSEVVQNEGTDDVNGLKIVCVDNIQEEPDTDDKDRQVVSSVTGNITINSGGIENYKVKGKTQSLSNYDMVRNTEYANGDNPFVYHCGIDIFNNHLLRSRTFKAVNPLPKNLENGEKDNFNTISDLMRLADGKHVPLTKRYDIGTSGDNQVKYNTQHLYNKDDSLSFTDSIESNLGELNGWFGFYNHSSVVTSEWSNDDSKWKDMNISRVLPNKQACDFIELYPDSTLFSFNPKYNEFQNREEQNWDICLTYPYENYTDHNLISAKDREGNNINALLLAEVEKTIGVSGNRNILMFRSFVKHNLSPGDTFMLCYKEKEGENKYYEIKDKEFSVVNTGNLEADHRDYYFYINDVDTVEKSLVFEKEGNTVIDYAKVITAVGDVWTNGDGILCKVTEVTKNDQDKVTSFKYTKAGDTENVYEHEGNTIVDYSKEITDVGDTWTNSDEVLCTVTEVTKNDQDVVTMFKYTAEIKGIDFRFIKLVNGEKCEYYFRKFKKLPNFRIKKEELTEWVASDRASFDTYVENNCMKNKKLIPFNKEQYPLAFSKTIYGDDITQVTFTDSINIGKIRDNLGRPLTDIYVTILKRNAGHDEWYKKDKDMSKLEFSHCFGELKSGLLMHTEKTDSGEMKEIRRELDDVSVLRNIKPNIKEGKKEYKKDNCGLDKDVTIEDNDIFYGDLVEFNIFTENETVLSDVYFRFNTEQREHIYDKDGELNCFRLLYDEIVYDDLDYINSKQADNVNPFTLSTYDISETDRVRMEGYYYKAHYPLKLRQFSELRQNSHYPIKVSSCGIKQFNGLLIDVKSKTPNHVNGGDIVYLYEKAAKKNRILTVNTVENSVRCYLNPMTDRQSQDYLSIYDIVEGLNHSDGHVITADDIANGYSWVNENGIRQFAYEVEVETVVYDYSDPKYELFSRNEAIPDYAKCIGNNIYLWRDVLKVGDVNAEELKEYPFANGHFYVNSEINFHLRRQDPFGYNGLWELNDKLEEIYGSPLKESVHDYKDETNVVC